MRSDIKRWTQACLACQLSKVHTHTSSPLSSFPVPDVRFDNIHIDIVGPLPLFNNYSYLLTCIDSVILLELLLYLCYKYYYCCYY